MPRITRLAVASGALALLLLAPVAHAAEHDAKGVTSGPASGSTAVPNAAVQKNGSGEHGGAQATGKGAAGVSAGSPGTTAKPGTEAGPAPGHTTK